MKCPKNSHECEILDEILDKIKSEIEQTTSRYCLSKECFTVGRIEWSDRLIKEDEVFQIIDKYKKENRNDRMG